jgi:hypothetical protein
MVWSPGSVDHQAGAILQVPAQPLGIRSAANVSAITELRNQAREIAGLTIACADLDADQIVTLTSPLCTRVLRRHNGSGLTCVRPKNSFLESA